MGRKKNEEEVKKDPLLEDESASDEAEKDEQAEEKPEAKPKAEKPEAKAEAPARPVNQGDLKAIAEATKRKLEAGPKTMFILPLAPGEREGAAEIVQINGWTTTVKKGVMVNIPVAVANVLARHYQIEMTAGQDKRLDRDDKVVEALS